VPPVYPPEELARGAEGWVELEYVVDGTGMPRDVTVVQSSPPGRFDAAALTAVRQYRYVPFEREGRVYERRLRLRVRFEVQ
jgi:protein TonB